MTDEPDRIPERFTSVYNVDVQTVGIDGWLTADELRDIAAWLDQRNGVKPPSPDMRAAVAATPGELAAQVAVLAREGYVAACDAATYDHDNGLMVLTYLVQVMVRKPPPPL
jgi:hypothetical protein